MKQLNFKDYLRHILFLTFIYLSNLANCQNFEWLRTYKASSGGIYTTGIATETDGSSTILINNEFRVISNPDTIYFGNFKFALGRTGCCFLVRLDTNGKVVKAISTGSFPGFSMCKDLKGNLYVAGYMEDTTIVTVGSKTLQIKDGEYFVAKFDKDLNFIWVEQYKGLIFQSRIYFHDVVNLVTSDGHIYFTATARDTVTLGSTTYYFGDFYTTVFGEISPSNGKIVWSNYLYQNPRPNAKDFKIFITGIVRFKGNHYIAGNLYYENINKEVMLKGDTLYQYSGFIVQTDSMGNYLNRFSMKNGKSSKNSFFFIKCLTTDNEHLYFGGEFNDTLYWGKQKIIPEFPASNKHEELFVASVTFDFKTRWFYRPKILDKTNSNGSEINNIAFCDGLIYFIGRLGAKVLMDTTVLTPPVLDPNPYQDRRDVLLFKTDHLGNIVWATNGGSGYGIPYIMDVVPGRSVFVAGAFFNKIKFGPYKDSSKYNHPSAWVTKITDFRISRDKVNYGPYCAGDSMKIPYSTLGYFDTSNYFVAQLSDEFGNFEKDYRELGQLKSNKDGIIIGKLPLFQVKSSSLYRIRIISTKPVAQSFYRKDTLRLLIYSNDKANPGKPESICYGDSIKLNSYGGTKWKWSPKYRMDDSTARQPMVWPTKTTTYRIIIGDSSGCGKPDTAYKLIKVRQPLKTVLAFNDTAVCKTGMLKIPYHFSGGDSVNYKYQWYYISSPKLWFATRSGQNILRDTLNYPVTDPFEKLAIILKDGCTNKPDTAYLIITQRKPVVIKTLFGDTALCSGHLLKYKATVSGGVTKYLKYQWKDIISNTVLSNTDSLKFITSKTLKVQLIVNDGCEALGDTTLFNINAKTPLKVTANLRDTILCFDKNLNLTATAKGGDSNKYLFSWVLDKKVISSSQNLVLKTGDHFLTTGETKKLSLVLKDNCSLPNDSVIKVIIVNPSPKAAFSYDLACSRTITNFKFTGTISQSPITTSFTWNFNNQDSSKNENPSKLFSTIGVKKIDLIVTSSNGCMDTHTKNIDVKFQSTADFTMNDVCENDSVVFINTSKDASGYKWRFGDGLTTTAQNTKHKYQITSSTTFNVSLVAIVPGGCSDSVVKAVTINENPKSDFSDTQATGGKVDFKANQINATNYRWLFGNGDSVKVTNPNYSYTYKKSSNYIVCLRVTNTAGCQSETCKQILITGGIFSLSKPSDFKIYPNPNSGNFTIEIDNPGKDVSIEVYNSLGGLVERVEKVGKVTTMNLEVANGIYLVRVKNGNEVWNQKMIVSVGDANQ